MNSGGALWLGSAASLEAAASTFSSNTAGKSSRRGRGGAVCMHDRGVVKLESCPFISNQAAYGGAVWLKAAVLTSMSNTFLRNIARLAGGAIFMKDDTLMKDYSSFFDAEHQALNQAPLLDAQLSTVELTGSTVEKELVGQSFGAWLPAASQKLEGYKYLGCTNDQQQLGSVAKLDDAVDSRVARSSGSVVKPLSAPEGECSATCRGYRHFALTFKARVGAYCWCVSSQLSVVHMPPAEMSLRPTQSPTKSPTLSPTPSPTHPPSTSPTNPGCPRRRHPGGW